MKKLFKRNSSKKIKSNLDGSFANISVDGSPGRSISQLSNYSGDSNYSLSNVSIGKYKLKLSHFLRHSVNPIKINILNYTVSVQ